MKGGKKKGKRLQNVYYVFFVTVSRAVLLKFVFLKLINNNATRAIN
jgi:hypothetical protein